MIKYEVSKVTFLLREAGDWFCSGGGLSSPGRCLFDEVTHDVRTKITSWFWNWVITPNMPGQQVRSLFFFFLVTWCRAAPRTNYWSTVHSISKDKVIWTCSDVHRNIDFCLFLLSVFLVSLSLQSGSDHHPRSLTKVWIRYCVEKNSVVFIQFLVPALLSLIFQDSSRT